VRVGQYNRRLLTSRTSSVEARLHRTSVIGLPRSVAPRIAFSIPLITDKCICLCRIRAPNDFTVPSFSLIGPPRLSCRVVQISVPREALSPRHTHTVARAVARLAQKVKHLQNVREVQRFTLRHIENVSKTFYAKKTFAQMLKAFLLLSCE